MPKPYRPAKKKTKKIRKGVLDWHPAFPAWKKEVEQHLNDSCKLQAVKTVKENTSLGLYKSKEVVDSLERSVKYGWDKANKILDEYG